MSFCKATSTPVSYGVLPPLTPFSVALLILLFCSGSVFAISLADYRKSVEQSMGALDTVNLQDESESIEDHQIRFTETLNSIRGVLPLKQSVEWEDKSYQIDNTWLHQQLGELEKVSHPQRARILSSTQDRLRAIYERLLEIEQRPAHWANKVEAKKTLEDILSREEFVKKPAEQSALARLWARFIRWLSTLVPQPRVLEPQSGTAQRITTVSQIVVVLLSVVVLAFVLKAFVGKLGRNRRAQKKEKPRSRVVLGERLEPEQSASDLLTEAETLARNGEIRTAIRKAYIALLVELGERKILSLAQHKTNRDYLRSLKERELLYSKMTGLTDSFERHWYGRAQASEKDWLEFRARYREALQA